uniref:GPS domain-containing protein n=1 Tax=Heligmosomoides polygyrus TaxID=6339 RepID=A0A183G5D6_HELPZ
LKLCASSHAHLEIWRSNPTTSWQNVTVKARAADGIGTVDVFTDSVTIVDHLPTCSNAASAIDSAVILAFTIGNMIISILTIIIWVCVLKNRRK